MSVITPRASGNLHAEDSSAETIPCYMHNLADAAGRTPFAVTADLTGRLSLPCPPVAKRVLRVIPLAIWPLVR